MRAACNPTGASRTRRNIEDPEIRDCSHRLKFGRQIASQGNRIYSESGGFQNVPECCHRTPRTNLVSYGTSPIQYNAYGVFSTFRNDMKNVKLLPATATSHGSHASQSLHKDVGLNSVLNLLHPTHVPSNPEP